MVTYAVATELTALYYIGLGSLIGGAAVFITGLLLYLRSRSKDRAGSGDIHVVLFIIAIILLPLGASFTLLHSSNSVIIIEKGSITDSSSNIGNNTYTSSDIVYAFSENMFTGNLTLKSKVVGRNSQTVNQGKFILSNGANAVSLSQNVLVDKLNSGLFLKLGTTKTTSW